MAHNHLLESQAILIAAKFDYDVERLWAIYWDELLPRVDDLGWGPVDTAKRAWQIALQHEACLGAFAIGAARRERRVNWTPGTMRWLERSEDHA